MQYGTQHFLQSGAQAISGGPAERLFNKIAGCGDGGRAVHPTGDGLRFFLVSGLLQKAMQRIRKTSAVKMVSRDLKPNPKPFHPCCIIRLVEGYGHNNLGDARRKGLRYCTNAAMMHRDAATREYHPIRHERRVQKPFGQHRRDLITK